MIDIDNDVFAAVAVPLREKYGKDTNGKYKIFVAGEYTSSPASFPAATIEEVDNSVYQKMRTANIENAASVPYEVNVFSNKIGYKKAEAQEIMSFIDEIMSSLGFTRTMCHPLPNLADATIYRLTARYEAIVDKDLWIYQNT